MQVLGIPILFKNSHTEICERICKTHSVLLDSTFLAVLKHWHYFFNHCPQTILQLILALGKTGKMGELDSLSYYIFKQHLKIHKSFPFTHHNPPLLYFFFFFLTLSCWSLGLTLAPETKGRTLMIRYWPIDRKNILNVSVWILLLRKHGCFPVKRDHGHMWVIPGFH